MWEQKLQPAAKCSLAIQQQGTVCKQACVHLSSSAYLFPGSACWGCYWHWQVWIRPLSVSL